MDYAVLVKAQVDEGQALIDELKRERFIDVEVALWVKRFEVGYWSFYLGSTTLASMKIGDAFQVINLAMQKIQRKAIGLSDINLVLPTEPIAAEAIAILDSWPYHLPRWVYQPGTFSDPSIQTAYLYPAARRSMSREQVVQKVAALMSRAGELIPHSISFQDGVTIQAVPTSIRRGLPGVLHIVLHDVASDTDRTVSADEIVAIR